MMTPTRKKLLSAIDEIRWYSEFKPIRIFNVGFVDENGVELYDDNVEVYNMDDLVAMLMDKSLSYRIVRISSFEFVFTKGIGVRFMLMPDKDHRTNIDAEFMEHVLRLELQEF